MKMLKNLSLCWVLLIGTVTMLEADKYILVDLDMQTAYAYENGEIVMSGRVATGKEGHRTPTGYYRILEKKRHHRSNLWPKPDGGARMDYMLRLTNTGIAMHLGPVPRYPASHGCIRMKNGFAQRLWRWAEVGTEVEVSGYPPSRVASRSENSFFDENYMIDD